jgi:hypothetical protein
LACCRPGWRRSTRVVVAPRELADPEDSGVRWVIRFALFVVSSLLGVGWLGLIGS